MTEQIALCIRSECKKAPELAEAFGHDRVGHAVTNALVRENITTAAQLREMSDGQVSGIRRIGPLALRRIRTHFASSRSGESSAPVADWVVPDTPATTAAHAHALHDVVVHAVSDADPATLRKVIGVVLGACMSERGAAEEFRQFAGEWKTYGDAVRQSLCEGHACGRHMAVENIEKRILDALELWRRNETARADLPHDASPRPCTVVADLETRTASSTAPLGGGE